jgi:choline dehydrogenase
VIDGINIARRIAKRLGIVAEETMPGPSVEGEAALADWVRDVAWGHHASCTCAIGRDDDPAAVLDGDFRVRGIEGLRVVDASVFPRIPGLFIASAVYMVSERASDVIIAAHQTREVTEKAHA